MKRKISLILAAIMVLACMCFTGCAPEDDTSCTTNQFAQDMESLNGQDNGYGGKHLEIDIAAPNTVKYATYQEVENMLSFGTGVIYFGFPECPWCRNLAPTLVDVANEYETNVLYFNNRNERDTKKLVDGQVVTEKEGTENYYKILELLKDHTSVYDGLEDDSIKRLYFPTVVFVKNGTIVGFHEGTVESQESAATYLTKEQQAELKNILSEYFELVAPEKCKNDDSVC
jgi:thiol-disulfide isomerase/thioredoxin